MSAEQPETASLNPNDILTAEFEYIAQTAFQANEDRARVTNFYLVTLGGLIAGLLGSQTADSNDPQVHWAFAALFVILFLASILTLLQLVRLREAWFESIEAMNVIKAYYQGQFPGLDKAFAWKPLTKPEMYKPWSVSFLLALQVALLGGTSTGAAVVFAGLTQGVWPWGVAVAAGVFCVLAQMALYAWLLRKRETDSRTAKQQAKAGLPVGH